MVDILGTSTYELFELKYFYDLSALACRIPLISSKDKVTQQKSLKQLRNAQKRKK